MASTLRALAVLTAAASLAGSSAAQGPSTAGTTPGTGHVTLDLTAPQPAECLGQSDGPWTVVAPYGWIFGMKGTVGAGRRTAQVNLSVGDAASQLGDLKGAAQVHVESGYGPAGVIADLTYLDIQPADGLVTVDSRATLFELLGMYRVVDTGGRQAGAVTFDVLAGARYYRFRNSITGNVTGLLSAERENDWIDLVVGARAGI